MDIFSFLYFTKYNFTFFLYSVEYNFIFSMQFES
jgi:hypothetical protein